MFSYVDLESSAAQGEQDLTPELTGLGRASPNRLGLSFTKSRQAPVSWKFVRRESVVHSIRRGGSGLPRKDRFCYPLSPPVSKWHNESDQGQVERGCDQAPSHRPRRRNASSRAVLDSRAKEPWTSPSGSIDRTHATLNG